jgi:hypothetical protein
MVIVEALKCRLNQGRKSNLFFYRDAKGNEVDLLMVSGADIFPIEIKAGMTITIDYFKGLKHFAKIFPDRIPQGGFLVYAGMEAQERTGASVVPFSEVGAFFGRLVERYHRASSKSIGPSVAKPKPRGEA